LDLFEGFFNTVDLFFGSPDVVEVISSELDII
jgi:hypothetical protein